jgi:hypothetical protein
MTTYNDQSTADRTRFVDAIMDALREADTDDRFLSVFPDMSVRTTTDNDEEPSAENYLIYPLMGDDDLPDIDEVMGIADRYFFIR